LKVAKKEAGHLLRWPSSSPKQSPHIREKVLRPGPKVEQIPQAEAGSEKRGKKS
jgi:hypothetical protein